MLTSKEMYSRLEWIEFDLFSIEGQLLPLAKEALIIRAMLSEIEQSLAE